MWRHRVLTEARGLEDLYRTNRVRSGWMTFEARREEERLTADLFSDHAVGKFAFAIDARAAKSNRKRMDILIFCEIFKRRIGLNDARTEKTHTKRKTQKLILRLRALPKVRKWGLIFLPARSSRPCRYLKYQNERFRPTHKKSSTAPTNQWKGAALTAYFQNANEADKLMYHCNTFSQTTETPCKYNSFKIVGYGISGIPLWLFEESYHIVGDLAETIALVYQLPKNIWKSLSEFVQKLLNCERFPKEAKKNYLMTIGWRWIILNVSFLTKSLPEVLDRREPKLMTPPFQSHWNWWRYLAYN